MRLGTIEKIFKDKILVVKLDPRPRPPPIGSPVFLIDSTRLGKVLDIVGRVDDPRALVLLTTKIERIPLQGRSVFVEARGRKEEERGGGDRVARRRRR
ncbi:MAG: hypothetical protein QXU97_02285 [Fervidicoccaceae archaeon]